MLKFNSTYFLLALSGSPLDSVFRWESYDRPDGDKVVLIRELSPILPGVHTTKIENWEWSLKLKLKFQKIFNKLYNMNK